MLGKVLKDVIAGSFGRRTPQGAQVSGEMLELPDYRRHGRIIVFSGNSEGNFIEDVSPALVRPLAHRATDVHFIHVGDKDWVSQVASAIQEPIWCVFSYFGVGRGLSIRMNGVEADYWSAGGIPLIQVFGDSPAYWPSQHVDCPGNVISVYGHPEHRRFRQRWLRTGGIVVDSPVVLFDSIPKSDIDFERKRTGTVVFPKNGNAPGLLVDYWQISLPPLISRILLAIAEDLRASKPYPCAPNLDDLLNDRFAAVGVDISRQTRLYCFLVAQLDDYLRRIKSTQVVQALLDMPIEVRGNKWEHIDFSGRKARYIPSSSYAETRDLLKQTLAVIDMSPNTAEAPHDRVLRAAGRSTTFLTNTQSYFSRHFSNYSDFCFDFTPDSIREVVDRALSNPPATIELGQQQAIRMAELARDETYAESLITALDACALSCQGRPSGTQPFIDFP